MGGGEKLFPWGLKEKPGLWEVSVDYSLPGNLFVLRSSFIVSVVFLLALVEFPACHDKFPMGYGWLYWEIIQPGRCSFSGAE